MFSPLFFLATWLRPKKRLPSFDEAALIEGLRRSDAAAYQTIVEHFGPMLLGYAWRIVGDRDEAEEVVQESLVSIFQNIQRFEERCSLRSWLFRIAHHKAIDHLRRTSRFISADDKDPLEELFTKKGTWKHQPTAWDRDLESQAQAKEMLAIVSSMMQKLPHHYSEILTLREVYEMDTEEICHTMGISAVNVRVLLHRARQALYQLVEAHLRGTQTPDR